MMDGGCGARLSLVVVWLGEMIVWSSRKIYGGKRRRDGWMDEYSLEFWDRHLDERSFMRSVWCSTH
jgi:hypothetical protein